MKKNIDPIDILNRYNELLKLLKNKRHLLIIHKAELFKKLTPDLDSFEYSEILLKINEMEIKIWEIDAEIENKQDFMENYKARAGR